MKTIYKYELELRESQVLSIPKNASILSAQEQNLDICLWAEVETDNEKEDRMFEIFGTGHNIIEDMGISRVYIDTIQIGSYVWHLYERLD